MKRGGKMRISTEMEELVDEFLKRDLASEQARERAKQLHSNGETDDALRLLLEDRRRRRSEAGSSDSTHTD